MAINTSVILRNTVIVVKGGKLVLRNKVVIFEF